MLPTDKEQLNHLKGALEAVLFTSEKPVMVDQLLKVLDTFDTADLKTILDELSREYDEKKSGIKIMEIAGGYQMLSNSLYASYIRNFYKTKHKEKLSKPALETLAIIAYKQPITRTDIELIRGVNSDGVVTHLNEKELIKTVGRKDIPGKPFLYGTTKQFMEYFGLKSLKDLPKLEEFPALQEKRLNEEPGILPIETPAEAAAAVSETAVQSEASVSSSQELSL